MRQVTTDVITKLQLFTKSAPVPSQKQQRIDVYVFPQTNIPSNHHYRIKTMFYWPAFARHTGQTAADNSNINSFGRWRSVEILGWEWFTVQDNKENGQNLLNRQGGAHPLVGASALNTDFSAVLSIDDSSSEEEMPDLVAVSSADSAGGNESEAQSYSGYTNDELDGAGCFYATGGGYEAMRL